MVRYLITYLSNKYKNRENGVLVDTSIFISFHYYSNFLVIEKSKHIISAIRSIKIRKRDLESIKLIYPI